jgi:hypothetical protein
MKIFPGFICASLLRVCKGDNSLSAFIFIRFDDFFCCEDEDIFGNLRFF